MSDPRELWVIESSNPPAGRDWEIEDYFIDKMAADGQREWLENHEPASNFRVVRYVPADSPSNPTEKS